MPLAHADRAVPRPRRIYTTVAVEPEASGFAVRLDGRTARTPEKNPLVLPTEALANLVAAEWEAQGTEVDLASMPATRLAFTAIDRTPAHRVELADEVARYAGSDLLVYFADQPLTLVEEQVRRWGPLLEWAAADLGIALERTAGILHRPQPREALDRARTLAAEMDDMRLTGLAFAVALFGSAVLAFAVERGELAGESAHDLARVDEAFQERQWGEDAEAAARTAARLEEARFVERWFGAL